MIRESDQYDHFGSEPLLKTAVGDILPKNRYRLLNQFFQISEKMDKESADRETNKIRILLSVCDLSTHI